MRIDTKFWMWFLLVCFIIVPFLAEFGAPLVKRLLVILGH